MTLRLSPIDVKGADRSALIGFMAGHEWPFHTVPHPSADMIESNVDDGVYDDDDHAAFWLDDDALGRVGYLRLEDLTDGAPLLDLRLTPECRGRGLAADALTVATHHVFTTYPDVMRFEGQTREDNLAMRRAFVRAGWVKEAHYRDGWPVDGAAPRASVAYAVLRRDWESGTTTPVVWDDL